MPPPPQTGRAADHQCPQYVVETLARLLEVLKPRLGAVQQLRRIGADPATVASAPYRKAGGGHLSDGTEFCRQAMCRANEDVEGMSD